MYFLKQRNTIMKIMVRDSNLELLRILAMFFILMLHANFLSLGKPDTDAINSNPLNAFTRLLFESVSIGAVNVFVLISGWFGIKPTRKKFLSFAFQCLFFSLGCYVIKLIFGDSDKSIGNILIYMKIGFSCVGYWFVISYIGLYILSPVLNAFVEMAGKHRLGIVVLAFFIYAFVYGWFFEEEFQLGYSFSHFIGLYLLARYVRLYPQKAFLMNKWIDLLVFVIFVLAGTLLSMLDQSRFDYYAYTSPLVVLSSLFLLLFFSKISMRNNEIINGIAISSFAVYLLHCHPLALPYYKQISKALYEQNVTSLYFIKIAAFMVAVFGVAIAIDKIRILAWNGCLRLMERGKTRKENS